MDFFAIIKLIFDVFKTIPQKQREQIIQTFIDLFHSTFLKKKRSKEDINKDDVDIKTYSKNITTVQWNSTIGAVTDLLPTTFSKAKKEKFTTSLIELVQSDEFLDELNKRIDTIDLVEDDLYQEQCSLEMRKLIAEMLRK
ncbi:hypothetical protein [Serratia sp. (in: enterobacteria)]|uniref:hypothetical protein n=1 Tax=Serratia sp. (in: enterobacteria) TaxID=616 RepID=UPI00398A3B00